MKQLANMRKKRERLGWLGAVLILLVLMGVVVTGCAQGGFSESADKVVSEGVFLESEAPVRGEPSMAIAGDAGFAEEAAMEEAPAVFQDDVTRLIIRTADMRIVVLDTAEAMGRIAEMAESTGGWVVDSNVFQSTETAQTGYMTIRVPAAGFQSALDAISGLATEVTELRTSGQDVTEEYVDLEARLSNLEATAERVRGFLDETRNVEEALAVSQELSRLEEEIERIKGRMQYLDQSAAFSTIAVSITPDELAQPVDAGGWRPAVVIRNAFDALLQGLQTVANVAIWLVITVLPIALIIALPIALIIYVVRRRRAGRRAVTSDAGATEVAPD